MRKAIAMAGRDPDPLRAYRDAGADERRVLGSTPELLGRTPRRLLTPRFGAD